MLPTILLYYEILNQIREGKIRRNVNDFLLNYVNRDKNLEIIQPTKLYPKRSQVDYINSFEINKLDGEINEYEINNILNLSMTEKQRIVPAAIKRIMEHDNYQFKFVISNEEDVKEMFRDFIVPFNIPLKNVVCMPGLDDVANFEERTQFVLEMAKKYKFRGLTRLHIAAWNKTLNV